MRVLWVTPQHPDPAGGGGAQHEHALLQHLAARHDIELLSSDERAGPIDGVAVQTVGGWARRPGPRNKRERAVLELTARGPAAAWPTAAQIEPLRQAIGSRRPDLVHITLGELAPVLPACHAPTSLLLFDSYTRHAEAALRHERSLRRRALARVELARSRRFERRWYRLADALACVSPDDAATVGGLLGRPVGVIPNPIEPSFTATPDRPRSSDTVLFVGSFGYFPNIEALTWLATEVWPLVEARHPSARLVAVGRRNDDAQVLAPLASLLGDRLLLDVADVRPHYWEAAVSVAPVRLGGGVKNKVLHAMACGAPVVATRAAIEGTGAVPGEHLLVADDADGLAAAIVATLEDPAAAAARAGFARSLVDAHDTARIAAMVERWWDGAIARHAADADRAT